MSSRILFVLICLAAGLWAFRHWRRTIQLALVLLVFEGALRKWVLPGAQDLIYFAKDGLLAAAYAGFLASDGSRRARGVVRDPLLIVLLGFSIVIGAIEIFNPHLPNILVGLLGFKAYFFYVPLLWVLPASFDSRAELWRFLYLYVLLAIPLGLLALLQFGSPASSALNTYARTGGSTTAISTFGSSSYVRVTSTFSYITGYVSYLFATALMILSLLSTIQWHFKRYYILYGAFGLTLIGMLVSGSRAPVLMFAVTFPLYWWMTTGRDRQNFLAITRVLVVVGIFALVMAYAADDIVDAFYGRASSAHDASGRILSPFLQPFELAGDAGVLGYGIGATHQAASLLVDTGDEPVSWLPGLIVEDESGRVMIETGILGFLAFYGLRLYLVLVAFRMAVQMHDRFCRSVAVACLLFFLTHLPTGIIFNVTASLYFWFFGGMIFLVARLDRQTEAVPAVAPVRRPLPGRSDRAVRSGTATALVSSGPSGLTDGR